MTYSSDDSYLPDTPNFAIFWLLKVGSDPANWVRLWSGPGAFDLEADETDTTGGRYFGLGFPLGLPAFSQAVNGASASVEFSLSGVDADALRLVSVDRDAVDGALVYLGIMDLDEHQQPASACDWLMEAQASKPRVSRTGQGARAIRTVTLPTVTDFFDRNLAATAYWSPAGQRARSADDAFFDLIPTISTGMVVEWPK